VNVYRFSSKEWDANAGLYYYLYRFYDPNMQRWPNRDPLGELNFFRSYLASLSPRERYVFLRRRPDGNEFIFVNNQPLSTIDPLGLDPHGVFRCQIEILFGHGSLIPQPLLIDPCAAASIVSCEAAGLSNPRPIPGIDPRPTGDISMSDGEKLADKDFEAGVKYAREICKTKNAIAKRLPLQSVAGCIGGTTF
jgi:RHS repeat-associated protein